MVAKAWSKTVSSAVISSVSSSERRVCGMVRAASVMTAAFHGSPDHSPAGGSPSSKVLTSLSRVGVWTAATLLVTVFAARAAHSKAAGFAS